MRLSTEKLALNALLKVVSILDTNAPNMLEQLTTWRNQEADWVLSAANPAKDICRPNPVNTFAPVEEVSYANL